MYLGDIWLEFVCYLGGICLWVVWFRSVWLQCTMNQKGMELDLELSPLPKGRQRCVTIGLWCQQGRDVYEICKLLVWGCEGSLILPGRGLGHFAHLIYGCHPEIMRILRTFSEKRYFL